MSEQKDRTVWLKSVRGWVSGTVAVISLVLGVVALNAAVRDWRETRASVEQLVAGADAALASGDFRRAKAGYDEANALDASSPVLREARLALSLVWLRAIYGDLREGETFTALTTRLLPSLYEGLPDKPGREQSVTWAHIGWAQHVAELDRSPVEIDARRAANIRRIYERAEDLDTDNFYIPLFRGYLSLDARGDIESAESDFALAIELVVQRHGADSDEYRWTREMVLAGSFNRLYARTTGRIWGDERGLMLLRSLNAMRASGDPLPAERFIDQMLGSYRNQVSTNDEYTSLMSALPLAEHRETFEWLLQSDVADTWLAIESNRLYLLGIRAALLEASDPDLALALYREIYEIDWVSGDIATRVEEGIARLGGEPPPRMVERLGRNYGTDPLPTDGDVHAFHLDTLMNFEIQFETPNIAAAFDYILRLEPNDPEPVLAEVMTARERILASYREIKRTIAEQGYTFDFSKTGEIIATRNMLGSHRLVADYRLRNGQHDQALAELDDAIAICNEWIPGWIYKLRARALSRRNAPGDLVRAADNLGHYIEAEVQYGGALNWGDVKTHADFAALREQARYVELMRGR